MRKRIINVRGTKYIRVASCNASGVIFFAVRMITVVCMCAALCACNASDQASKGWETYCKKYNVDSDNPTVEQENFYLDCYAGSVEEEKDLGL